MQVRLNHIKNLHFKASTRNFRDIDLDEPESFHGTNLGPSPVEYLMIGIGGCLGSSFMYCLTKHNIKIENLEVLIDGKITHKPPTMRLKLAQIDVKILYVVKDFSQGEKIESCIKKFKEHCVVTDSIVKGLAINIECKKKNN